MLGRLALIRAAQAAGFTLTKIADLLEATPSDSQLRGRLADCPHFKRYVDSLPAPHHSSQERPSASEGHWTEGHCPEG